MRRKSEFVTLIQTPNFSDLSSKSPWDILEICSMWIRNQLANQFFFFFWWVRPIRNRDSDIVRVASFISQRILRAHVYRTRLRVISLSRFNDATNSSNQSFSGCVPFYMMPLWYDISRNFPYVDIFYDRDNSFQMTFIGDKWGTAAAGHLVLFTRFFYLFTPLSTNCGNLKDRLAI